VTHALPAAAAPHRRARPGPALAAGIALLAFVALAASAAATLPPQVARHPRIDAYYLAVGAAFVCYAAGLLALRRRRARLALVLAVAALVQVAPLAGPLLLSQDVGSYWDYGRIAAVDGGNPYSQPPVSFRRDPAFAFVSHTWRRTTSAYGPLFTAASEGGALVAGRSQEAASSLFKTAAAVGALALAALAALVSSQPAFAAAAVGWNPLFAIDFAGGGHNDVWMMVPLLGALALDRRGRRQAAGALWAVAAAVKWIPLLLLPLRASVRERSARFGFAGFAAGSLLVAAGASLLYGDEWLRAFGPVAHDVASGSRTSVVHLLRGLGLAKGVAAGVLVALFAASYLVLVNEAKRRRARLGLAAGLLLLATPWIVPWYASWALPLAAAEDDGAAILLSVALTGYLLEARAPL
jgi:hypothetical protein